MKIFTFGYGMKDKSEQPRAILFKRCLEDAGVQLLLDIRYSPYGGFWNPKKIDEILTGSTIRYLFKDDVRSWHKLFGVPKNMRTLSPWDQFSKNYIDHLLTLDPQAFEHLLSLVKSQNIAVMCCEPYLNSQNNCHRFALTQYMCKKGMLTEKEIVHLDMDCTAKKIQ